MATSAVAPADSSALPPGFEVDPAALPSGFEVDVPKRKVGVIETALRTAADAARPVVRTFDMAAAGLAGIFGDTAGQEQIFSDMQKRQERLKEEYAQKPTEEFSTTGEVAGGVASMPQALLGQGVAPGIQRATEVVEKGGTLGEAAKAGSVTGAVQQALQLLPMHAGGKVAEKIGGGAVRQAAAGAVTGAAINVPAGMAARAAENAALPEGKQFEDLEQPNDLKTIATEAGLSAAFGALGAHQARRTKLKAEAKAAEAKAAEFPADKFTDLGDGNFRAPNGSTITKEAWDGASKRVRDGWMEEAPKPPGEPKLQEEIDRLREEHPTGPVAGVVNEVTRQREKVAKTKADAAELRRAAEQTTDAELKKALNARAEKLDPSEKIPVGEVRQGQPKIETELPKKIPVGEVKEGQPELKGEKPEKIPVGETTEEKIPVGETDEIPGEGGKIPVGEAKEITHSGVEPTPEPKGPLPTGEVKELYIPPEKRNASDQVPKQESVQQERVAGNEGGQTAEASGGDRVLGTTPKPGPEAVARDWGATSTEAAQKIRDLKAKGDISALEEAKMLSIADKHKSDPNIRTVKLNNFMEERGQPIAGRKTKPTEGHVPEEPEGKGKSSDIDPDVSFDLTFPKIEAGMLEHARVPTIEGLPKGPERGHEQVTRELKEGIRDGRVDKDGGSLALWALDKNPNLARGLTLKAHGKEGPGLGLYGHASRVIDIFKGNNSHTATHEILHHSERMMPTIVQAGIRREWKRALHQAIDKADTPLKKQALKDILASALRGDAKARQRVMQAMIDGKLDKHAMYHLTNPSEFWAVNASRLLHERHAARGSWRAQAKQWLKEMIEHAKGLVGVRSDSALLKGLNEVLNPKKTKGFKADAKMMSEGGGRKPREVPRDFQDPGKAPPFGEPMSAERYQYLAWESAKIVKEKQAKLAALKNKDDASINWSREWEADTRVNSKAAARAEIEYMQERAQRAQEKAVNAIGGTSFDPKVKVAKRTLGDETKSELTERKLFDRFNRVAKLQTAEAPKTEKADIYQADQLFQGRAQHRGDMLERDFVKPLGQELKAARKLDLTVADADDYLMALHAPERNREIARINPKMQDGGSGLTNKQAKDIVDSFTPEQRKALDKVAKIVHDMNRKKLNDMVSDGLITADLRDTLNRKYKNYVPLKSLDQEEQFTGIGQGYSMRATDIKEALGRGSKAGSPIAASMMDAARSIVRGEKAHVDKTIWEYAKDPKAHDFIQPYNPDKPPAEVMGRKKGPDGQVKSVVDPNKVRDLTVDLVIDGEQQKVFVPDQLLRDQIKKLATQNDPGVILGAVGKVTGSIGRMLTEFNPAFTFPNAARDAITVGVRAKAHGLAPGKVLAGIPVAWGTIINYKRGVNTPGAKQYEEFLAHGGKTGAYGMTDLGDTMKRLEREGAKLGDDYSKGAWLRTGVNALKKTAHLMSGMNEIFEYASRFSAYQQARATGKSASASAAIAKEISVNFNRSGEYGRALNSVLVFANASLQGLRNTVVYGKHPAVQAAMLGIAGLGGAVQAWNEMIGGTNEDTGEPNINSQNDAMADKNLMLMMPGGKMGAKIPLPPEYSWLYAMGRRTYRGFSQGHTVKEAAGIVGNLVDAVLPVRLPDADSGAGAVLKSVVLTPVVPIVDLLGDNKNYFGQNIVPDRHDDISPAPYFKSSRTTTSDVAKDISEGLNTVTGGDNIRPGKSEKMFGPLVSPEGIEHIVGYYTGGVGQLALQSKNLAKAVTKGEEVDVNKIPIANRFMFEEPKSYTSRRYKELRPEFEYAMDYEKAGKPENVDPNVRRALSEFMGSEKELRVLFKQLKSAASSDNEVEKKQIEQQIKQAQSRVIRAYYGQPAQ